MFEFLFFVTALYLGYVAKEAYQAVGRAEKGEPVFKQKTSAPPRAPSTPKAPPVKIAQDPEPAANPEPVPAAAPSVKPVAEPKVAQKKTAATKAKPAAKAATKPKAPSKSEAPKIVMADELKNPETGEITPVPANYRFAKKWIKDALVQEKLLDRVYKPSELDAATSARVKEALDKLRTMKNYQA